MISRVSEEGTPQAEWDKSTWAELYRLARGVPAAGVWVQGRPAHVDQMELLGGVVMKLTWVFNQRKRDITGVRIWKRYRPVIGGRTFFLTYGTEPPHDFLHAKT